MNVDATITIDRPVEDVFAYVANVRNMPKWVTGVSSAEMVSSKMEAGARFACRYTSAFRPNELEIEVTSFEAPTTFGMRSARGPFNFEGTILLTAEDGKTRVTNSIVADPDSVATRLASWLFGWLVRHSYRKRLARELEALRAAIAGEKLADA